MTESVITRLAAKIESLATEMMKYMTSQRAINTLFKDIIDGHQQRLDLQNRRIERLEARVRALEDDNR